VKRRRSLTHVGGKVESVGASDLATMLAHALDVQPSTEPRGDDAGRAHVHGFHGYPARMHPVTARRLVRALSGAGSATVLDPFCGSGTVLVEAMIAGNAAVGTDLSPLAVGLARLKTTPFDPRERQAIVERARTISAFATGRRKRRAGATRRYPPEDVETFDPHVLLELDSIRAGIEAGEDAPPKVRLALELGLSAILVKVSRRESETSARLVPQRLAAGFTTRLFERKCDELARRLGEMAALLPERVIPARVEIDDATRLRTVAASTVDIVVTSPPYVGTYDYTAHHALRMRWLELDAGDLARGEMGARRRYAALTAAAARSEWSRELCAALRSLSRVCRTGARIVFLMGDSAVAGEAIRAEEALGPAARDAGLALLARASQPRPHFHKPTMRAFRDRPRAEQALLLQKG
jgi:SAM-dependent methyltransferase